MKRIFMLVVSMIIAPITLAAAEQSFFDKAYTEAIAPLVESKKISEQEGRAWLNKIFEEAKTQSDVYSRDSRTKPGFAMTAALANPTSPAAKEYFDNLLKTGRLFFNEISIRHGMASRIAVLNALKQSIHTLVSQNIDQKNDSNLFEKIKLAGFVGYHNPPKKELELKVALSKLADKYELNKTLKFDTSKQITPEDRTTIKELATNLEQGYTTSFLYNTAKELYKKTTPWYARWLTTLLVSSY